MFILGSSHHWIVHLLLSHHIRLLRSHHHIWLSWHHILRSHHHILRWHHHGRVLHHLWRHHHLRLTHHLISLRIFIVIMMMMMVMMVMSFGVIFFVIFRFGNSCSCQFSHFSHSLPKGKNPSADKNYDSNEKDATNGTSDNGANRHITKLPLNATTIFRPIFLKCTVVFCAIVSLVFFRTIVRA